MQINIERASVRAFQQKHVNLRRFNIDDLEIEQPGHPVTVFAREWAGLAQSGQPKRTDFKPMDVRNVLEYLAIFERDQLSKDSHSYRFRLVGDRLRSVFGANAKGQQIRSIVREPARQLIQNNLDQVIENGSPCCELHGLPDGQKSMTKIVVGFFPFAPNTGGNDQVFMLYAPEDNSLHSGVRPLKLSFY